MPAFRAAPVRVRVPATSANLGSGFDAFGLALALYDDVVVRIADAGLVVDVAGEGADTLPRTEKHLVVRAARAAFRHLGGQPRGLEVVCANRIPQGRGLGSSAAAICAGVLAARALTLGGEQDLDLAVALALATELEGHPDNVAACLHGGLTLAWRTDAGPRAVGLPAPVTGLSPLVFVPERQVSTGKARRLLPETVPFADAAHAAGRTGLLVEALTRRPELLLDATDDRLHQPYRAAAMPASLQLVARLRRDGVPAMLSGAGPAVIALLPPGTPEERVGALVELAPRRWTARRLDVDRGGAAVLPFAPARAQARG